MAQVVDPTERKPPSWAVRFRAAWRCLTRPHFVLIVWRVEDAQTKVYNVQRFHATPNQAMQACEDGAAIIEVLANEDRLADEARQILSTNI